jgi:hypothetical protein
MTVLYIDCVLVRQACAAAAGKGGSAYAIHVELAPITCRMKFS